MKCALSMEFKKCLPVTNAPHCFQEQCPKQLLICHRNTRTCHLHTVSKNGYSGGLVYATMVSALSACKIISTLAAEIATVGSLQSSIIPPCLLPNVKKSHLYGEPRSSREFIYWARHLLLLAHLEEGGKEGGGEDGTTLIQYLQMQLSTELIPCFTATNKL